MRKSLITIAILAFAIIPSNVVAATDTSTLDTSASSTGTLDLVAPANLTIPDLDYNPAGGVYGYSSVGDITVTDGRGTGEGWSLSVSSSPLTEVGGKGLSFPAGSLTLYKPVSISTTGTTTNQPTITSVDYSSIDAAPFTIVTADVGKGLGVWNITMGDIELYADEYLPVIDKTTYPTGPTPYQSTITWTLSNTP